MLEFIHKKSGVKRVIGKDDEIRKNCLMRAGFIPSGEYVAPVVEEVVPEPTVGDVVDSIAEANPEPEQAPMVAVEAVHEDVDPAEFVDLLDPPDESEESNGEEAIEQIGDAGSSEDEAEVSDDSDIIEGEFSEVDLERVAGEVGGEVSSEDSVDAGSSDGATLGS